MKNGVITLLKFLPFFFEIFKTISIAAAATLDIHPNLIECPKNFKSPFCTCSLLQFQKIGIFCEKQANSLEQLTNSIFTLSGLFIDTLVITNTPIYKLKPNAFGPLKVGRIVLSNNSLAELQTDCFTGPLLDSLEELEIIFNRLTSIPTNGVADLKVLKSLVLVNNLIEAVPEFSFLQFYSRNILEVLDLSANNLSTIAQQGFLGLERLKKLSLNKNHFEKIPTHAIASLAGSLEELWMGVNLIHEVEIDALPLPKLKALSLDVNRVSKISGEVFRNTPNLLYLYLSNNALSEIDPLMFQYIGQLKVVSMNYNMVSRLNKQTFQFAPSIVRLELANCFIGLIEEGTFWTIPKSQYISLANNKLRRISQKIFASLPLTVALDLSNNIINEIEDFAFSGLPSLQMLDLSGNQIEKLPPNTFFNTFHARQGESTGLVAMQSNVVARVLNLHDNPWNCDQHLLWLVNWLKQITNVQITAPGNSPTSCAKPFPLKGVPLRSIDTASLSPSLFKSKKRPKPSISVIPPHKWPSGTTTSVQPSAVVASNTMLTLPHSSRQEGSRFVTVARRKLAVPSTTSIPQPRPAAAIAETNFAAMVLVSSLALIGVIALLLITIRVIIKRNEDEQLRKTKKGQKQHLSATTHPVPRFQTPHPYTTYYADPSKRARPTTSTTHFYGSCYKDVHPKKHTSPNISDSYWWF